MAPFDFLSYIWAMMFYGGVIGFVLSALLFIPRWRR